MAKEGLLARRFALIVVAAAVFVAPAGASAATFYVDDSAASPDTPCTNPAPASACDTINAAITQARGAGFTGPDTIMVAAGNYPEVLALNDDDDVGLTIDGAGTSTSGAGTVVQVPTATTFQVRQANISVKDIAIQGSNAQTLLMAALVPSSPISGQRLENVTVEMNDQMNPSQAISIANSDNAVLNHVTVTGDSNWDDFGVNANALKVANSTNVTVVNDSRFLSNSRTVYARASTLTINRSLIVGPFDLADPALEIESDLAGGLASLTVDSSLVALGSEGVRVRASFADSTANAVIRNSTVDPGMPKGTPDLVGVGVIRLGPATVGIEDSIVVGGLTNTGAGAGAMTCNYSDIASTVVTGIACSAAPGNPGNNSTTAPASLFVPGGFLGLDWHLLPNSPAIDTASPGALAAGQSTTDFDGNARLLDGNFDCVARRDKGAHEVTGQSAACPVPGGPTVTPPTTTTQQAAPVKKCKKKRRTAAAAKKKRCKKKHRK